MQQTEYMYAAMFSIERLLLFINCVYVCLVYLLCERHM